jgi:hypothetical protein
MTLGGQIPLAIGVVLWGMTLFIGVDSLFKHDWTGIGPAMVTLLFGGVFGFAGVLSLYVVSDSSRCLTLEELSARLNVSEDALIKVTIMKQILPRYNVMGRIVYRPGDFDLPSLTRTSSPSTDPDNNPSPVTTRDTK